MYCCTKVTTVLIRPHCWLNEACTIHTAHAIPFKRLLVSFAVHAGDTVETHERAEQKLKISNETISSWVS